MRLAVAGVLTAGLLALLAPGAVAATEAASEAAPGVRVAPAVVELDLVDGRLDRTVTFLAEGAPAGWDVSLRVARLGHDLDGRPRFDEDPAVAAAVQLEDADRLHPASRLDLRLQAQVPAGQGGLYAAVVGTFTPDGAPGPVVSRLELASLLLLRGPQPWIERIEIDTVELQQADGGYELRVVVTNIGDVHVRPSGTATVTGPSGERLGTVALAGQVVLPGYARRLAGAWAPAGPLPQVLTVDVRLDDPAAAGQLEVVVPTDSRGEQAAAGGQTTDADARTGLIGMAALVLLLALGLVLWVRRQLRDDDEPDGGGSGPTVEAEEPDLVLVP